jgi:hypothetical protein
MAVPAPLSQFFQSGPGLRLFHGDAACLTVGLLVGLRAATPSRPLLVVDGANSLDPYLLADLARRLNHPPAALLASVVVSRPFTAYQLDATIVDRLDGVIDARQPSGILLAGLLDLLHDEDVGAAEAQRIFKRILTTIRRLTAGVLPVIVTCPAQPPVPGREGFLPRLVAAAAWVFAVADRDGVIEISGVKPATEHWRWEPAMPLLAARRFS